MEIKKEHSTKKHKTEKGSSDNVRATIAGPLLSYYGGKRWWNWWSQNEGRASAGKTG